MNNSTGGTGNTIQPNPTSCADDPACCAIQLPSTVKESLTVQEPHERLNDTEAMLTRLINALGVVNEKLERLAKELNSTTKDDGK